MDRSRPDAGAVAFPRAAGGHPPVSEEQEQELPILRIGSDDYEPYSYLDETGDFTGIDVDLAKEACRRLGYRPEFHQVVWETKTRSWPWGNIDCLWGSYLMTRPGGPLPMGRTLSVQPTGGAGPGGQRHNHLG